MVVNICGPRYASASTRAVIASTFTEISVFKVNDVSIVVVTAEVVILLVTIR